MARVFGVVFQIGASVGPTVASAFQTVQTRAQNCVSKIRQLTAKSAALDRVQKAQEELRDTQRRYAAGGGTDPVLREALQRQIEAYRKARAEAERYGASVGNWARQHERANRELQATRSKLEALQKAQAFRAKKEEAAAGIKSAVAPALAIGLPIREAIKFESAMADVAKTIDGMRDDDGKLTAKFYEMEAAVKAMGQSLPLTHNELAKLFAAGGQQGMTAVADLREFTIMAAQMSVAFGMGTEEAADAIGGYRSALNLTMPQARELLDLMNQYANTTSASEKGIADVVRRIGSLGSVGGVAAKPVTALAATLDAMKIAPEVAATGIKNLILAMTAGAAATDSQVAAFGKLGINNVKLAEQMQKDGPAAIVSVLEAVKKLPKAEQLSTMQKIFGKESLGSIAPLLANLDKVKENLRICGDTTAYAGAMQKEYDARSATTENKLILLNNRFKEMGITVMSGVLPAIQSLVDTAGPAITAVANFAGEHKGLTSALLGGAAALLAVSIAGKAVMWFASGLGQAFQLVKAATVGWAVATKIAAGVQWLFNAAMSANPIGITVMAVAALAGGMVWLYKTCEPVRAAFDSLFGWLGEKFGWMAGGVKTVVDKLKSIGKFFGFGGDDTSEAAAQPVNAQAAINMPTPVAANQIPPQMPTLAAPEIQAPQMPALAAIQMPPPQMPNLVAPESKTPQMPEMASPQIPPLPAMQIQMPDASALEAQLAALRKQTPELSAQASQTTIQAQPAQYSDEQISELLESMKAEPVAEKKKKRKKKTPKKQEASDSSSENELPAPQAQSAPQIIQPQVQVAVNVTQNGVPDQEFATGVMNAIRQRQAELEKMISALVHEQARLAYSG